MAFWGCTVRKVSPECSAARRRFTLSSLQRLAGRNDTITSVGEDGIFVESLNSTIAVRDLRSGDSGELPLNNDLEWGEGSGRG